MGCGSKVMGHGVGVMGQGVGVIGHRLQGWGYVIGTDRHAQWVLKLIK